MNSRQSPVRTWNAASAGLLFLLIVIPFALSLPAAAQAPAPPAGAQADQPTGASSPALDALKDFDAWMEQVVKDWNVPGIGVGVVVKDQLVFARGYGYRDYGRKLPFTPQTTVPIASNTKLFTAMAVGLLVDEGRLEWDKPVRDFVPGIQFYNDDLDRAVSIRDMLSHRTGITRHDLIWYRSDFSRKELFERLKYLEPKEPIRTTFLYNNMMYTGAGYVVELLSGRTWEEFVRERLLLPLGMKSTTFTIDDMTKQADCGVPYTEKRDSFELYSIPYYRESNAVGPAGAINSNLEDMSRWVIALLNGGRIDGRQVIPAAVIKATTQPATPMPNAQLEARGWGELLNSVYGMGRWSASYRGHLLAYHGGDINGFHSQVSCLPQDGIGVVVLVIGDHCSPLYNVVTYNVYERLLGMDLTPWSERQLAIRLKAKEADKQARSAAGGDRVPKTRPSHPLEAYLGEFEHPAYGVLAISMKDGGLFFDFHKMRLPLSHFHYDRFETPDDEEFGKWSVNFQTNPQGDVDQALMSLDEAEVTFTRRVAAGLSAIPTLQQYAGTYQTPTGASFQVVVKETGAIGIIFPGQPFQEILPWKPHQFRIKEFSDVVIGFVVEGGKVVAMTQSDPSGTYRFPRK
jgi:CubicO group peptidase (beta-lactamase class C family)